VEKAVAMEVLMAALAAAVPILMVGLLMVVFIPGKNQIQALEKGGLAE